MDDVHLCNVFASHILQAGVAGNLAQCRGQRQRVATQLGAAGIDSILLEGGSTLAWSALESGIVQKVQAYIAPKIFGGASSKTPVGGTGFPAPDKAICLKNMTMTWLGQDLLLEGAIEGKEDTERCSQD